MSGSAGNDRCDAYGVGRMDQGDFHEFALRLAPSAAAVANYCDHADHNEETDRRWVDVAAHTLISEACKFADAIEESIVELYADRIAMIESRNVLCRPGGFVGRTAVLDAMTWRDIQLAQIEHDRFYHPDVIGLSKSGQLQHYALHLSKLVGAFAEASDVDNLVRHRLPDVLLFGLKLLTVMGTRLPEDPLPGRVVNEARTSVV